MKEHEQDMLIERLVDKLGEVNAAHNSLVLATQALLAQVNMLALKVQALEEQRPAQAPEGLQIEDL